MGAFNSFRQHRASLTGAESVDSLVYMEDYFRNGANWAQGVYHAQNGAKCMVGAADHVRVTCIDDAKHWLRQAIAERKTGATTIEQFNDASPSYEQVAAVIDRAKQLAKAARLLRLPAPEPVKALVGEILPPLSREFPVVPYAPAPNQQPQALNAVRRSLAFFAD